MTRRHMLRSALIVTLAIVVAALCYLLAWPIPIDPVVVTVNANPGFTGAFAPNEALGAVQWLGDAAGRGPEDVWIANGFAYSGLENGHVIRVPLERSSGGRVETVADTKGR